jgi:hypothetical protein
MSRWRVGILVGLGACGGQTSSLPEVHPDGPSCPSILVATAAAEHIVTDDANVYWAEKGAIRKVGKGGGTVETLAEVPGGVGFLTLRSDQLYFAPKPEAHQADGIYAVATRGGAATPIVSEPVWASDSASTVAYDDGWFYFIEPGSGHVKRGRADGTGGVQLLIASFQNVAVEALAVDGDEIYFADSDGNLGRMPKAGGQQTPIAASAGWPAYLHPVGDFVYYSGSAGIRRVPKSGGAAEPMDADCSYCDFLVYDSAIYRADGQGLLRMPMTGGAYQRLMTDGIEAFTIDASGIYFGSVRSMDRAPVAGCAP